MGLCVGGQVKLTAQFRGREMEFKELGMKLFEKFQHDVAELASADLRRHLHEQPRRRHRVWLLMPADLSQRLRDDFGIVLMRQVDVGGTRQHVREIFGRSSAAGDNGPASARATFSELLLKKKSAGELARRKWSLRSKMSVDKDRRHEKCLNNAGSSVVPPDLKCNGFCCMVGASSKILARVHVDRREIQTR
ncbi:unnamed protein product [Closterium sp. NIES-54]